MRESGYVYAAVAPEQGRMSSFILPSANTAMMNLFLAQVAEDFADDFLVMQVDQAGWHRAKDLQVEDEYAVDLSARLQPRSQSGRTSVGGGA